MKKLVFIISIVILQGCGQSADQQRISVSLQETVKQFKQETGIYFTNTHIFLSEMDTGEEDKIDAALCTAGIGINVVNINNNLSEDILYPTLMHELGHCLFGLQHNDELHKDGCSVSIMISYEPQDTTSRCFPIHKQEYIDELKKAYKEKEAF